MDSSLSELAFALAFIYWAGLLAGRDENGTEIFRIDRFCFLYYEPFFNMKNCQFQSVLQPFSTIFFVLFNC
jgi:hypothetical protein